MNNATTTKGRCTIRRIDINDNAIIRPLRTYKHPLLFINGQAMHPALDGVKWQADGTILIPGAKLDMMWSVVELAGTHQISAGKFEEYIAPMEADRVSADGRIHYSKNTVPDKDYSNAILFVKGLLIKAEEIDPTILEPADEIMIYIDGLYYGAQKNNGYTMNWSSRSFGKNRVSQS